VGVKQLSKLDENNEKRNIIAQLLNKMLNENILPQKSKINTKRIYYFYVVRSPRRKNIEQLRRKILRQGIDVGIKGEITDDCSKIITEGNCPVVKQVYNSAIQLPIYDELKKREITIVARVLNKTCCD
jgi:dTDP-4-amino-4,6-dideoxygalactose transaminase